MKLITRMVLAVLSGLCFSQVADAVQTAGSATPAGGMFPDVVARVNGQPVSGHDLESVIRR